MLPWVSCGEDALLGDGGGGWQPWNRKRQGNRQRMEVELMKCALGPHTQKSLSEPPVSEGGQRKSSSSSSPGHSPDHMVPHVHLSFTHESTHSFKTCYFVLAKPQVTGPPLEGQTMLQVPLITHHPGQPLTQHLYLEVTRSLKLTMLKKAVTNTPPTVHCPYCFSHPLPKEHPPNPGLPHPNKRQLFPDSPAPSPSPQILGQLPCWYIAQILSPEGFAVACSSLGEEHSI